MQDRVYAAEASPLCSLWHAVFVSAMYESLCSSKSYDDLERALLSEQNPHLRRRYDYALFSEAVRGHGPPDGSWVQRLVHHGLHRALNSADRASIAKRAYSSVSSGLEANIAARVVELLES